MSEYYTQKILDDLESDESVSDSTTINLIMLESGLLEKIDKLKAKLDQYRWRDVKVEPPEINTDLIGRWWLDGKEKCHLDDAGAWWWLDNMDGIKKASVAPTHWMPMPSFEVEG